MATETKKNGTRTLTDDQKKAAAERMAKARAAKQEAEKPVEEKPAEVKPVPESTNYTEADVQRMIQMALAKQAETLQRPQVIQVQADVEKVLFLWQAQVCRGWRGLC